MKVIVAGGGIGGLTAAIALRRKGLEAQVFERVPELKPVGAGLSIQINAMRALAHIGLADRVRAAGATLERTRLLDWRGAALVDASARELTARFGQPTVCLHRARLHELLVEALGPGALALDRGVTGWHESEGGVEVSLSDGSSVRGDLLVGADGLRSTVRLGTLGDTPLRSSGCTSWRGVCGLEGLPLTPGTVSETWGPGRRFGLVPIGNGELYWFATANAPPGEHDGDVKAELLGRFEGWHAPIADVLRATPADRVLRTDIYDRPPVARWVKGRVALLGDAAHPMTPNLGQGACQAIEDAVLLAEALASGEALATALSRWERTRAPRANRIVDFAYRYGRLAQLESPVARFFRDGAMRLAARLGNGSVSALFDFSPTRLEL